MFHIGCNTALAQGRNRLHRPDRTVTNRGTKALDQLGNLDFVAREVVKAEDIVDYTRRENVAERLVKRFGAAIGDGAIRALKSVPALR